MIKENYHTHTIYCDGDNTPEEMINKAIELGFNYLGFSGHGHTDKDGSYCMSLETTKKYMQDITVLKEKYKDKITVLLGVEQDIISNDDVSSFDYVIGSSHYIEKNGKLYNVDGSKDEFEFIVNNLYNGSIIDFAKEYYQNVSAVVDKTNCQIIGHFDLISKNFERCNVEETKEYLDIAKKAVDKLVEYNVPFEINTGAMSRGYRTSPYPSKEILKYIFEKGGKIIFNSDCHNINYLDNGFDMAVKLAKEAGFTSRCILTEQGIKEIGF